MDLITFVVSLGLILIYGTLLLILKSQGAHQRKVETLLTEIRDKVS